MLAAHHDQENLVLHQPVNGGKPAAQGTRHLQPKTPGARYPKTPLKVPLNDENAARVLGGKSVIGGRSRAAGNEPATAKGKGLAPVTPLETRVRAPLGNKTTNAKTRTGQTIGVKEIVREIEKTQTKATTVQKPKQNFSGPAPAKVAVHNDDKAKGPLEEPDIEYCPPRPRDLPYESDVLPAGALTFEGLKPENLFRGYYKTYYDPVDEDGVSLRERQFEEKMAKALEEGEQRMLREIEECDWSVCDVPESATYFQKKKGAPAANLPGAPGKNSSQGTAAKRPPTIASRKAASILSMESEMAKAPKPTTHQAGAPPKRPASFLLPKVAKRDPIPSKSSTESAVAEAASRSTIGYTKGRSASSIVQKQPPTAQIRGRAAGPASTDKTITPSRTSNIQAGRADSGDALQRLQFLSIFNVDEDEDELQLGTTNHLEDDADEEFELKLEL